MDSGTASAAGYAKGLWSEFNPGSVPRIASRFGTRERLGSLTPALACVPPGAAPPSIQQSLALCIEVKKSQDPSPLRGVHGTIAADEFVIGHAAVRQDNSSPRPDA